MKRELPKNLGLEGMLNIVFNDKFFLLVFYPIFFIHFQRNYFYTNNNIFI